MADTDYRKIKAIYESFVAFLESVEKGSGYSVNTSVAANYDRQVDDLTTISRTDYSTYKISSNLKSADVTSGRKYNAREVHQVLSQVIGLLNGQYDFGKPQVSLAPVITIDNSNRSEINIQFKTVLQVADEVEDVEIKEQLYDLDRELNKSNKNLEKIRTIVIWLIQRSWEVFLSIAPVLLEKVGKNF